MNVTIHLPAALHFFTNNQLITLTHKLMPVNGENISNFRIFPMGDSAIVVQFGHVISAAIHARVQSFAAFLDAHPFPGMVEYVPAFTTVTIFYDHWLLSEKGKNDPYEKAVNIIQDALPHVTKMPQYTSETVEIPVCYGGEFGPDLDFVANYNQSTPQEVIRIHAGADYRVYMIGFSPGFPYLGGMDNSIAAPRKDSPRHVIPAGSVGIAGEQTGIYPIETPGGWQLIGRTPLPLFTPHQNPPVLLKAGNVVRFIPITEAEYLKRKEPVHEH